MIRLHLVIMLVLSVGLGAFAASIGCGDKIDPVQAPNMENVPDIQVTYEDDIQYLMADECLACHSIAKQGADRNGAPLEINFDTYENVVTHADEAAEKISSGTMPPDGGLPQEDRDLFQAWIEGGMLLSSDS